MIKYILSRTSKDYRALIENVISLSLLQFLRYILPFITFPYLVRKLGVEGLGLVAFAMSFVGYFQLIVDYSFNLTAVKDISLHRDENNVLEEIFNSVFFSKLLFGLLSAVFLLIIVFTIERFREYCSVYLFSFYVVFASIFLPVWFFQGLEKMKYVTILSVLAQGTSTILILVLIQGENDYWKVPLINGTGIFLSGLISLMIINFKFKVKLFLPRPEKIFFQIKSGWDLFASNIAINLYTVSTTFLLGLLTNSVFVGYYSAADKIIQAVKGLLTPLSQSLYPYLSKKFNESIDSGLNFARKVFFYVSLFTIVLSLSIFIFADRIVLLILGDRYEESINVIKILSVHPFLIGLSNILGIQIMIPLGKTRAFRNILILASIFNILLSTMLVPIYKHIGSAISVTLVELFVTLSMFIYLKKVGINILDFQLLRKVKGG